MKLSMLVCALALGLSAAAAQAHDPALHDPAETTAPTKPKATTCAQLADSRYSADASDPKVKELKARCEAEKKAGEKAANAKKPV